ncbi:MAG: Asp23/Gls24 family envelope stress response protein [Lachnospiraceae bacterium]|jgi:uncharacterized alkaline shock family protein YloU|nr:Asp23/Gls24 family envelope stress response protein [Lachnospiraceae bacterium]
MSKENEPVYGVKLNPEGMDGHVQIANDVIASVAALAATEAEGVAYMSGKVTKERIGKIGIKNFSKGAKIGVQDGVVNAELSLVVRYGYSIPKVSKSVQERVRTAIEGMTGLTVARVNVHIVGVDIEKA